MRIVRFEECDLEPSDAEFYKEFSKYNEASWWIALLFLMTVFCVFAISLDESLTENGSIREVSCIYNGLKSLNWNENETTRIFYPRIRVACIMYDYDINMFKNMTFEEALDIVNNMQDKPRLVHCSDPVSSNTFSWERSFFGTCKGYLYKQRIITFGNMGTALGSIVLGTVADIFGRKISLMISVGLHILGTNLQTLITDFDCVKFLTVIKGIGRAGIDLGLLLLLLEHAGKINRPYLIVYMKTLGSVGVFTGIYIKKHVLGYTRELRFILSVPSVMLLFYLFYVPESPRWYLSHCHKKKAWRILNKLGTHIEQLHFLPDINLNKCTVLKENMSFIVKSSKLMKTLPLGTYLLTFLVVAEFAKRQFLAINNLRPFSHHVILCFAKLFSYMYVLLPLMMLRRRLALIWFFSLISVQLFINLFTEPVGFYIVNALIMLCVHAVRNILTLYLAEVCPTCIRGSCLGIIVSVAYAGYTVHCFYEVATSLLERIFYFVAALIGIVIIWFLPEIKVVELPDYKRYRRDYKES